MADDEALPRLPLRGWALELARRWNSGAYALFILHGNVFDVFPVQSPTDLGYGPLKTFLARRLFPERAYLIFYDIADGLTFGSADMQTGFFEWLAVYDQVEKTDFHREGPPREFTRLAPLLRRFFLRAADDKGARKGVTLIVDFPEKIVPAAEEASARRSVPLANETISLLTPERRMLRSISRAWPSSSSIMMMLTGWVIDPHSGCWCSRR